MPRWTAIGSTCFPRATEAGGTGCYADQVCNPATSKCAALPAAGSPCIAGRCGASAYCAAGQCAAQKADGEPCTTNGECINDCDRTSTSPTFGKCYSRPTSACSQ